MVLYVLNSMMDRVGIVDQFKSLIWTPRYQTAGDFELLAPANAEIVELLQRDNFVMREDDPNHAMIIEQVKVQTDEENGHTILVSGRDLKSILYRRIIWKQTMLSGTLAQGLTKLLNENIIEPTDAARAVDGFTIGDLSAGSDALTVQYTCDNLGDTVDALCASYGIGYDVTVDTEDKTMEFSLFKGKDRSYEQEENPYVVFSPEYENLVSTIYQESVKKFYNVANVGGEGEGDERKFATAGDASMSGLDRYELFVDKKSMSTNRGEITPEEYTEQLIAAGEDKLAKSKITRAYEGSIQSVGQFRLGIDYELGDVVEVVNEFGMEGRCRISAIIDCLDETGRHIVPTFEALYTDTEYWVDEEGNYFTDEMRNKFIFK